MLGTAHRLRHVPEDWLNKADGARVEVTRDEIAKTPDVAELVARSRCRDAQAFTVLIARCERLVLAVAFAAVQDPDLAGDLTQETFLRAWQKLSDLQDPNRFEAWVCGIVRHLAADHHRRARLQTGGALCEPEILPQHHPVAQLDRREQSEQIGAALAQLDDVSRSAVVLRYYEGLSSRQIGELLELSPAAVDMRLSRARETLRARLSHLLDGPWMWAVREPGAEPLGREPLVGGSKAV